MNGDILSYFGEEPYYQGRIIAVKYFYIESEAALYAARLRESGIKSFISNANTITAFPMGNAGIGLHVRETDRELSLKIIRKLDLNNINNVHDFSFHDADHEDIAYERAISEQKSINEPILLFTFFILSLLIFKVFIQSKGFLF